MTLLKSISTDATIWPLKLSSNHQTFSRFSNTGGGGYYYCCGNSNIDLIIRIGSRQRIADESMWGRKYLEGAYHMIITLACRMTTAI